jgi:hypothetical protein
VEPAVVRLAARCGAGGGHARQLRVVHEVVREIVREVVREVVR